MHLLLLLLLLYYFLTNRSVVDGTISDAKALIASKFPWCRWNLEYVE